MSNRFALPIRHCPDLDVLAAFLGFLLLFFQFQRTNIVAAFLVAAAVVWFVARWIHEDQYLNDTEMEIVRDFLNNHSELHYLCMEALRAHRLTYRNVREIERNWRVVMTLVN